VTKIKDILKVAKTEHFSLSDVLQMAENSCPFFVVSSKTFKLELIDTFRIASKKQYFIIIFYKYNYPKIFINYSNRLYAAKSTKIR